MIGHAKSHILRIIELIQQGNH